MELIVVMLLLSIVAAIAAPRLAGFVAGRHAEEEVRRLVAVTRFAGEESISRGDRVELWIRPDEARYGVRVGTEEIREFTCQEKLSLQVAEESLDEDRMATILFWPDGTIDESSPETVEVTESGTPVYAVTLDDRRLAYEAQVVTP
jgi:Tfp pilus assembly protein FimT